MTTDKKLTDGTNQIKRITREIDEMDTWAQARVLAYRSQRDHWQLVTYILLGFSAGTAIGAGISAGLKVQLWTIIFAGVSAGLSVINASLKTPTQITKSETAFTTVSALRGKVKAFRTDLPDLSAQNLTRRLEQVRKEYEQAQKLPSPSYSQLTRAAKALQSMSVTEMSVVAMANQSIASRITNIWR
jgi:hypothetical protein